MSLSKWLAALLLVFCGPLQAKEVLPVAIDHLSLAFVLDDKKAPLPMGTRVDFSYKGESGVPERIRFVDGFVLGTHQGVVFIELSENEAAKLALYRAEGEVSYQKVSDPVAEEVAVRQTYADNGNAIILAPSMRRLTLTMEVDAETAQGWSPGQMLTFFGAREDTRHVKVNGEWERKTVYKDMTAMFRSAVEAENGQFEVTIVADPFQVNDFLQAELEGRLTANPASTQRVPRIEDNRCYVSSRHGSTRREIEIPCSN